MCGIIGYIGKKQAKPILINGLTRLEYRGYDSAGIATIEETGINIIKNKGRVSALEETEGINSLTGNVGIGHTRWATHGVPSSTNSHPHSDNSKTFAVVHNGIVENYAEIKNFLISKGYKFYSETDTEVIPNLIHYYYSNSQETGINKFLSSVINACNELNGSYALEILCNDFKDNMIVVRKDSPLVIGKGKEEIYVSSDIPAILSFTRDFYLLNNNEFALLSNKEANFYNQNFEQISKEAQNITWDTGNIEKEGYSDFMLKEIHEQPKSTRETIGSHINPDGTISLNDLNFSKEYLESLQKIYIVACGTAMHAGLTGKAMLENICKISTEVDVASEFRYRNPIINEKTLCIFISQSGETADTIAALKLAKSNGAKTLAVSNVIGSSITREADYTIYTHAGPEIAVASTKAYTAQVMLLAILSLYFAQIMELNNELISTIKEKITLLPSQIEEIFKYEKQIKELAKKLYKEKDVFFIGRGTDYTTAMEGSLKLKEISYIHSEAYPAGELKHGPIALIEKGIPVISIITNESLAPKTVSNIQEVISRGAKTIIITNLKLDKNFDEMISIPETVPLLSAILGIIPLQLLAYYISKEKGLDVDKPRNLAKSVTVE